MTNILSRLKIKDILDRDPDKFEPNPRRAWAIIFFVEILLIVCVFASHLSYYLYMHTDGSFKSDDSTLNITEIKLNRKGLSDAIAMFEAKKAQYQELIVSMPAVADPSQGLGGQTPPVKTTVITPTNTAPKTGTSGTPVSI